MPAADITTTGKETVMETTQVIEITDEDIVKEFPVDTVIEVGSMIAVSLLFPVAAKLALVVSAALIAGDMLSSK